MLMKHVGKTVPKFKKIRAMGPLTVTAFGIILSVILDFGGGSDIPLVGDIPKGLPSFTAGDWFPLQTLDKLMVITISIAIVGFMESIASKSFVGGPVFVSVRKRKFVLTLFPLPLASCQDFGVETQI